MAQDPAMAMCLRCQPQEKGVTAMRDPVSPAEFDRTREACSAVLCLTTIYPLLRDSEQSERPIRRSKQVARRIC
jgi:hypothetical protein